MIKIREIKIDVKNDNLDNLKSKILKRLKVSSCHLKDFYIRKKSIDARRDVYFIYEVDVSLDNEDAVLKKNKDKNILKTEIYKYSFNDFGDNKLSLRPVIVGSGPSGLFCAYILSYYGYKPIVIERGMDVDKRVLEVKKFWESGVLNEECNVSFGEGGAGTFSDGKLNTLIKDEKNRILKVFEVFVKHGAPESIMYDNKPHIGTDILRNVVKNMRLEIIKNGGSFYFEKKLTDIDIKDEKVVGITVNDSEYIPCSILVLGTGHSARDIYELLERKNVNMKSKPFAVGVRVEHAQKLIDENQYGSYAEYLDRASYKLTYKAQNNRGVYSFCMCPGGYVVNASSEKNKTVINGMSNYKRDSGNSNSAIIVTVSEKDYGKNVLDGIKYQEEIEKKTFDALNGKIPVQLWKDFIENKVSTKFDNLTPKIKGEYAFYDINKILPKYISDSIKEAIYFNTKIKGFTNDCIISCSETRTSSAVTILRDDDFESNIKGLYPIGEGAGHSGGITTSSVDGIKAAEKIMKKYEKPVE